MPNKDAIVVIRFYERELPLLRTAQELTGERFRSTFVRRAALEAARAVLLAERWDTAQQPRDSAKIDSIQAQILDDYTDEGGE